MFVYQGVKGTGVVMQGDTCHNCKVKATEIRLMITSIEKEDLTHHQHRYPIEANSFAAIPVDCLKLQ